MAIRSSTRGTKDDELQSVALRTYVQPGSAAHSTTETVRGQRADPRSRVDALLKQLFVDDALLTAPDFDNAKQMLNQLVELFSLAKMMVHKMNTNNPKFKLYLKERGLLDETVSLLDTLRHVTKALGLRWDTDKDEFWFDPHEIVLAAFGHKIITKRVISRYSSKAYDPPGVIGPVTLQFKILFHEIWKEKIGWDSIVPDPIVTHWRELMEDLRHLATIRVPRYIMLDTPTSEKLPKRQLHVFCDASLYAYGAVAYSRTTCSENAKVAMLASKTKVCAVSHSLSIARIELEAAELGTQLAKRLIIAYDQVEWEVYLHTDSMIAYSWINGDLNRRRQWVRNRVETIRYRFGRSCWRHCPGKDNPADLASRGCSAEKLSRSSLWWGGPSWLTKAIDQWPKPGELTMDEKVFVEKEAKAKVVTIAVVEINHSAVIQDLASRCGTFGKLNRILCFIFRFFRHLKEKVRLRNNLNAAPPIAIPMSSATEMVQIIEVPCISAVEFARSERRLIQEVQRQSLSKELNAL